MTSHLRQDLDDTMTYLAQAARTGYTEGNVGKVLNGRSPEVRQVLRAIKQRMDSPRDMPYQPKLSEHEQAERLGLDPELATRINDSLDGLEVTSRLQSRLGTDADLPDEPLSRREQIATALEHHAGE
jgi:hypothetical protein